MRAIKDKCEANEGVICWIRKRQEIKNKKRDQYKEAVHTLNMKLTNKLKELKEETRHREEAKKAKTNLTMELATLRE